LKDNLKILRKEHLKISQQEMAEKLNITQSAYAYCETGKTKITERIIADICREFNVRKEWLETGEEPIFKGLTEEEELEMQLKNALKGKSESLIQQLMCIAQMNAAELKILLNAGLQIHEFYKNEEFKKKVNEKM